MHMKRSGDTITSAKQWDYNGSSWTSEDLNITANGNVLTDPNGTSYQFDIYNTRKVDGKDLYLSNVFETITQESDNYEVDKWDWKNPSYYSQTQNKKIDIHTLNDLISGFTTGDDHGEGIWFGEEKHPMFLNQDPSQNPAGGAVVAGEFMGYDNNNNPIVHRTDTVIGSWTSDSEYIKVPKSFSKINIILIERESDYYPFLFKEVSKDKLLRIDTAPNFV